MVHFWRHCANGPAVLGASWFQNRLWRHVISKRFSDMQRLNEAEQALMSNQTGTTLNGFGIETSSTQCAFRRTCLPLLYESSMFSAKRRRGGTTYTLNRTWMADTLETDILCVQICQLDTSCEKVPCYHIRSMLAVSCPHGLLQQDKNH